MTENQWLTSIDPQAMYAFIRDRVTERQQRFFVEACRVEFDSRHGFNDPGRQPAGTEMFADWVNAIDLPPSCRADLLREIIGNPFRPIVRREGEFWRSNVAIPQWLWEEKPPNSIEFDPAWLTWNNGTVANLVRAIMEEECGKCQIIHGEHSRYVNFGPDSHWEKCSCNKGYIPRAEPQWDLMPILGDALESAGCMEAAILDHLRGTEPCLYCTDCKMEVSDLGTPFLAGLTPEQRNRGKRYFKQICSCNGTGKRPVRHVRGCWCVELLMGGMQ